MIFKKNKPATCKEHIKTDIEISLHKHSEFRRQVDVFSDMMEGLLEVRTTIFEMIDILPEIIWFKDKEYRFIFLNKIMAEKVYHRSRKDIIGRTHNELNDSKGPLITDLITYQENKKCKFIQAAVTLEGEKLRFECYKIPLFSEKGIFKGIVGYGRDITKDTNYDLEKMIADGTISRLENGFYYYL